MAEDNDVEKPQETTAQKINYDAVLSITAPLILVALVSAAIKCGRGRLKSRLFITTGVLLAVVAGFFWIIMSFFGFPGLAGAPAGINWDPAAPPRRFGVNFLISSSHPPRFFYLALHLLSQELVAPASQF